MDKGMSIIKDCPSDEELEVHRKEKKAVQKEAEKELRALSGKVPGRMSHEAISKRIEERRIALEKKISKPAATRELMHQMYIQMLDGGAEKIIKELMRKAMDPEDKDQVAAMKMCVDRLLPANAFEKLKENNNSSGRGGVTINISGLNSGQSIEVEGETYDNP